MQRSNGCPHVIDELQSLRRNDAIKGVRSDVAVGGQIRDDRRRRVAAYSMKHIGLCHSVLSESDRIVIVRNFHYVSAYINRVLRKKVLDVVAVNRLPSLESENLTDRFHPAQTPKSHPSDRGPNT